MPQSAEKNQEFLKLYNPCHNRLGRFVAALVWENEEAKDVVSETLLIALENIDTLRNKDVFLHYLFGIAIRVIRKRKRKSWRTLFFDNEGWNTLQNKTVTENTSDTADLYRLLNKLTEKSREAIVMFEIAGFSINEISEMQNCSVSAVKSRLVRAREILRKACRKEKNQVYFKTT